MPPPPPPDPDRLTLNPHLCTQHVYLTRSSRLPDNSWEDWSMVSLTDGTTCSGSWRRSTGGECFLQRPRGSLVNSGCKQRQSERQLTLDPTSLRCEICHRLDDDKWNLLREGFLFLLLRRRLGDVVDLFPSKFYSHNEKNRPRGLWLYNCK